MSSASRSANNPFSGLPLERFGEQRELFEPGSFEGEIVSLRAQLSGKLLTHGAYPELRLARMPYAQIDGQQQILLGHYQGVLYSVHIEAESAEAEPAHRDTDATASFLDLRSSADALEPFEASLAAYARAMVIWHSRHRYCGVCGATTSSQAHGHRRRCDVCASEHFPRVDPAIIVAVSCAGRLLLARQSSWPERRYSVLAGFVEPGESLEDCVRREVFEESGVIVEDCDYHSSQPWPFPSALMLGFTAQAATEALNLGEELQHALWVSPEELVTKIVADEIRTPTSFSISKRLIDDWFQHLRGQTLESAVSLARQASGPK